MARISLLFCLISLITFGFAVDATFVQDAKVEGAAKVTTKVNPMTVSAELGELAASPTPKEKKKFMDCLLHIKQIFTELDKKRGLLRAEDILVLQKGNEYLIELEKVASKKRKDLISLNKKSFAMLQQLQEVVAKEFQLLAASEKKQMKEAKAKKKTMKAEPKVQVPAAYKKEITGHDIDAVIVAVEVVERKVAHQPHTKEFMDDLKRNKQALIDMKKKKAKDLTEQDKTLVNEVKQFAEGHQKFAQDILNSKN